METIPITIGFTKDHYENGIKIADATDDTPVSTCPPKENGDSNENNPISETSFAQRTDNDNSSVDSRFWIFQMPEILEYVFNSVSNHCLKKFRHVNTTWNREACRVLRRTSYCHLRELNAKDLAEFTEIFGIIQQKRTPSPFRRYYVSAETLQNEFVDFILSHSDIHIIHLNLRKSPATNNSNFQQNLHKILTGHRKTIEYFRCALRCLISLNWNGTSSSAITTRNADSEEQQNKEKDKDIVHGTTFPTPTLSKFQNLKRSLYLPALKDFGFWEHDEAPKDFCMDFITNVINGSPSLTHLCPGSFDQRVLIYILNNCNLTNVQDLYILFMTDAHVAALVQTHLPKLKTLTVQVTPRSNLIRRSASLHDMVSSFAGTLENLTVSWFSSSPDEHFPTCPKLESLVIGTWSGPLNTFSMTALPRLKKLHVQDLEICNFDLSPHYGVEEFIYESTEENLPYETMEEHEGFIEFISCQYPRLKSLDLTSPLSDELVRAVIRNFPLLETLILDTDYSLSESVFTGINMFTLRRHLLLRSRTRNDNGTGSSTDNPSDGSTNVNRMPSLRDMNRLKTLVIGRYNKSRFPRGLLLTNNAIEFGLGMMPALKVLQLNWNPELSMVCVRENLNHLSKIIINNSHSYERYETLENLKEIMPQVDLDIPKHGSHLDKRHDRLMLSDDY